MVGGAERPQEATGWIGQRERVDFPSSFMSGPACIGKHWRERGWGDGSGVKSTGCISRGPVFDSQPPHVCQPTTMCNYGSGGLTPASGLHGHQCTHAAQPYIQTKHL